jgi:2,3-bisphosphoglycerate-independent phosphoglycerate mutase
MKSAQSAPRPVVLCILDGWGVRAEPENNAIAQAATPVWDRLMASCPTGQLEASEEHVGLPSGQMGNSEVGHMNLGAGRVIKQDLPRIDTAIADGSIATLSPLTEMIAALKLSGGTCHVMGLLSPGGVHAHQAHMLALARIVAAAGVPVAVHGFLDGRDTAPRSAAQYVADTGAALAEIEGAELVSLCGRYFAMDRDNRWDRVSTAYNLVVDGVGERFSDAVAAVQASYDADIRDEFVEPVVLGGYDGMNDGDGVLMANFRADRTRQILSALVDPAFDGFVRNRIIKLGSTVGLVEYSTALNAFAPALFPSDRPAQILGQVVSEAGRSQLRIAETEKYAHVTFFLNGGRERVFEGEDRILVPSPDVATYDLCPEMSAVEVTDNLVRVIDGGSYDLIVVNYANGDMVGHTGILSAAIQAVETLDSCLARLEAAVTQAGGVMLVTADHGNCERMIADGGDLHTSHTLNVVPTILVNASEGVEGLRTGRLCDVAPTLLELMGLEQPAEMTGQSLITGDVCHAAAE